MQTGFQFSGRTVLVTGGARGIGLELSRQLAAKDARVLAVGRDGEALAALSAELAGAVDTFRADLQMPGDVRAVADWVAGTHPDCSVLVNNAAVMHHVDLTRHARLDTVGQEIAINLTAPLQLAVALLPALGAHPSAAIVNVTSGLAIAPRRDAAVYCATKAALRSFTRSLRDQCRHAGLPVTVHEAVMTLVDTTLSRPAPVRKYPPARAAADVLAGVERGQDEIWIEKARLLRVLHRVSPQLAYRVMRDR